MPTKSKQTNTVDDPLQDELRTKHPAVSPLDSVPNSTPDRDTDVTPEEIELLDKTDRPVGEDTANVEKLALDDTDGEDPLNEEGNPADLGQGLDIPGAELDDEAEEIGNADEENNAYSNSNIEEE